MLKPIQTIYKGYKFRSRLEARWAVFFDAVGVKWDYEVEGYVLDKDLCYLPDFILHDVYVRRQLVRSLWVEVKGELTDKDIKKAELFSGVFESGEDSDHPLLIVGNIPLTKTDISASEENIQSFTFIDGDWDYKAYFEMWNNKLGLIGSDAMYRFTDYEHNCYKDYKDYDKHQEKIYKALSNARQARFEHGSKGE